MKEFRFSPANQAQATFLNSTANITAYVGGLGSGKTHVGAFRCIENLLKYPHGLGLIGANTYDQLEKATLSKLFELMDEIGIEYHYNSHRKKITFQTPGLEMAQINTISLEEAKQTRGVEYLWAWLDEARDTRKKDFDVILGRTRQKINRETGLPVTGKAALDTSIPLVRNTVIVTTTPDMNKARWLYDYLHNPDLRKSLEDQGLSILEVQASSNQNPYLPKEYTGLLAATYDPMLAAQEVEGKWVAIPMGKPVFFSVFNDRVHLEPLKYDKNLPIIVGIDWGFHSPAAVFCQLDSSENLCVLGEYLGQDMETGEFCEAIQRYFKANFPEAKLNEAKVYCDPAGNSSNSKSRKTDIQIAREYGLMAISRKTFIADGISTMRRLMSRLNRGRPALVFDTSNCFKLVEGLRGGYHYPEQSDEWRDQKVEPFKDGVYDHLFDALRYVVANLFIGTHKGKHVDTRKPNYDVTDPDTGY